MCECKNNELNGIGIYYNFDSSKMLKGTFKDAMLDGNNCEHYKSITILRGTFK